MSDAEESGTNVSDSGQTDEQEKILEGKITKAINKLRYYLEETDELIENNEISELQIASKRTDEIRDELNDFISRVQELKLDSGNTTQREIRLWKKDLKASFAPLLEKKELINRALEDAEKKRCFDLETEKLKMKFEEEEKFRVELQEREKALWEERLKAEMKMTEKKLEMETAAKIGGSKLPELKITPFKGTPEDWIRFENMFTTQVDKKPISAEEKFGYLLELVDPKIRKRLANLKPGETGYKTAWDRLKTEYGQTKTVVAAHIEQIINLPTVKGSGYNKVHEFYETLIKSYDALQTLGEESMLKAFVLPTMNKLPNIKADLVRTDEEWEEWGMETLIKSLQMWLKRNQLETAKDAGDKTRERNWFGQDDEGAPRPRGPYCIFGCKGSHWGDACPVYDTLEKRRRFFSEKRLCFNCGRSGHRENKCRARGCYRCKARHHTSLCNQERKNEKQKDGKLLNGFSPSNEDKSLPAIVPIKIQGVIFWAYLDTGSGRNFVSKEAINKLRLKAKRHETRNILTVNGTRKQSMPVFDVKIESVDGQESKSIELTGSKMTDFTTVKRPTIAEVKEKYPHVRDKLFYRTASEEYPIHVILGDAVYCQIKTENITKGEPDDPIVEGTTFGWIVHGGKEYAEGRCMFTRETNEYERLYSLDVLGIEDQGEDDQFDVYREFQENINIRSDGRFEVSVPWIPGAELVNTNEEPSRKRLKSIERKLSHNKELRETYEAIVKDQLEKEIIEPAPVQPTGPRVFYLPHKPVVREQATSSKVRMVFDASGRPSPLANSVNECMHTGPSLQPLLWNILIRARMSPHLVLADIEKAFLQIGLKEEDRDAFRFLFNINGQEQHFRFARVPFGAEASPFMLGATINYLLDHQPDILQTTVQTLRDNTYVDNLMKTASDIEELNVFKEQATHIFESAKFPVHKWESDVPDLDTEPNPSKILGHFWDKREDILEIKADISTPNDSPVTKRTILSKLGGVYDPLGIISPTMVEGKRIYREACDDKVGWNIEVSDVLKKDWMRWTGQLRNVRIPRSIAKDISKLKRVHLHVFSDASNIACSAVTIAVIEHSKGIVKGLLTSKSRISKRNTTIARLELVSGHMAANMVKNLLSALRHSPIASVTVWMDSLVALYWICNPGKSWKVFVSNRVRKIAEITQETGIEWKHCPTDKNLADLGSRGASLDKMENGDWFAGPDWLLDETEWPTQPKLQSTKRVNEEYKPIVEGTLFTLKQEPDEWDFLLKKSSYWKTLRVTAWMLRFVHNALTKKRKQKKAGPLTTEEISKAECLWVRRAQKNVERNLQTPGWKLVKDEGKNILKCKGRIQGYEPVFIPNGDFAEKLIRHIHEQVNHLGVANTMSAIREKWWVPRLRSKVKKVINGCNLCRVFSAKPYGTTATADLPTFRTECGRPFETTGIDFAGPLSYKISKREEGKCYIIIFTCATSRAVHLEVTKSQTAEEFQRKLNAFVTRRTRPKLIVSDNATTFKATSTWIRKIRKSESLQDHLSRQEIRWQFNLSRSPWWGGMYERLIKEIKKTLYKTMGRSHLLYEQMEALVMDIERHLNNRPLTYVESENGEEQVLTPNVIMWGQDSHIVEDIESEGDEVSKLHARLMLKRQHAWQRWKKEYIHSLMENHRIHREVGSVPEIGEIVLLIGDEKNRGEWTKGKVVRHVKGKDGVVRGVTLLHKGHYIQRPLTLVCPLEIKAVEDVRVEETRKEPQQRRASSTRKAAKEARERIRLTVDEW